MSSTARKQVSILMKKRWAEKAAKALSDSKISSFLLAVYRPFPMDLIRMSFVRDPTRQFEIAAERICHPHMLGRSALRLE
jgi:hypothetical protein